MSELVLYYSFTGNTKQLAEVYARVNELLLCEIRPQRRLGKFAAYAAGCFKAMKGEGMPVEAPAADLSVIKAAHIFAPIWAGHPAFPMNSALALLPKGTKLSLHMVSASGESNQEKITERLQNMGLEVTAYEDIRK